MHRHTHAHTHCASVLQFGLVKQSIQQLVWVIALLSLPLHSQRHTHIRTHIHTQVHTEHPSLRKRVRKTFGKKTRQIALIRHRLQSEKCTDNTCSYMADVFYPLIPLSSYACSSLQNLHPSHSPPLVPTLISHNQFCAILKCFSPVPHRVFHATMQWLCSV